jgi:1-acyl-sn-glycerol-3-phosphate acyltransferase
MKEYVLKIRRSKAYFIFYTLIRFSVYIPFKIIFRMKIFGRENIPASGRLIICSNHLSYIDPVMMGLCMHRQISFMAKSQLFTNRFVAAVVTFFNTYPVNRGAFDRQAIRNSIAYLNAEQIIGLYPEGTRSTDGILREGHQGVGLISVMSGSPVLPVAITGSNMIIQKPHKRLFFPQIKISFGKPIDTTSIIQEYGNKQASEVITLKTMSEIKKLYEEIKNAG